MTTHPTRLHLGLLPGSRTGWASFAFAAISVASWWVFSRTYDAGYQDLALIVFVVGMLGGALAALVATIIAVVRSRDLALVLVVPFAYGLLASAFLAGELVMPH